jgi:predicted GNAT family acetyltransferase
MLYKNLIGKKVKYYAGTKHNLNFQKVYKGEELTIKGIDTKLKMIVVETISGEVWKLTPLDVRFLNNMRVTIF